MVHSLEHLAAMGSAVSKTLEIQSPYLQGFAKGLAYAVIPWTSLQWRKAYEREHEAAMSRYLRAVDALKYPSPTENDDLSSLGNSLSRADLDRQGFRSGFSLAHTASYSLYFGGWMMYSLDTSSQNWDTIVGAGLIWAMTTLTDFVIHGINEGFDNLGQTSLYERK